MAYRTESYAESDFDVYFFKKNLQGDIIAVLDDAGTLLVSYVYDAWGNCTTTYHNSATSSSIAAKNPFRYRGYYYDTDLSLYYCGSRYYDPVVGRWINGDSVIASVSGSLQGYNMFAYCFNNPVNMDDHSGNWPQWIKNSVKWFVDSIVKPIVLTVENTISKIDLTYSAGINVSGTPGAWIFNGQVGVSVDTQGNVAVQVSGGGGITTGTPGVSVSGYRSVTNAPSIDELNGIGYQVGGSAIVPVKGIPIAVGGDFNIIPDSKRNKVYYGNTTTGGLAIGSPGGELHVEWGSTATIPTTQFNIYDVARSIYNRIMEW